MSADAPALSGQQLEELVGNYRNVMNIVSKLSRVYSEPLLESLIYIPTLNTEDFASESKMNEWVEVLNKRLEELNKFSKTHRFSASTRENKESQQFEPILSMVAHGVEDEVRLGVELFESDDYRKIRELGESLDGLVEEGAFVQKGERKQEVSDFKEALAWIMQESKRGYNIQRYKGLGEMNPEQLWETTMDPESRRMLQVTVEDAIAADQIFTTLMGDQVEPRRDFIDTNALSVANLDV